MADYSFFDLSETYKRTVLKTYKGVTYSTIKEAALQRGLLLNDLEWQRCLEEAFHCPRWEFSSGSTCNSIQYKSINNSIFDQVLSPLVKI